MQTSFFRTHPLTKGLSSAEIERLRGLLHEERFAAGELLCREGATSRGLLLLAEGAVRITKRDPSGAERDLAIVEAPSVLGELELLSGRPSLASAVAAGAGRSLLLSTASFEELLNNGDPVAAKMTRNIARVVIDRLAETSSRVAALFALANT